MNKRKSNTAKVLHMPGQDPTANVELVSHRSRAGLVALDKMADRLDAARSRTKKAVKRSFDAAVTAHANGRDHSEKATEAVQFAAEADRLGARIAILRDASQECRGAVERSMAAQGDMFDPGKGGGIDGMGWSSEGTRQAIYSCLLTMSQAGEKLDPYQAALLSDLGGAGLEALEFGLDASEAVESDGAEEEPDPEADDDDDMGLD